MTDSAVIMKLRLQNLEGLRKRLSTHGGLQRARREMGLDRKLPRGEVRAEIQRRFDSVLAELRRLEGVDP